jgi:hypothetical protein
MTELSTPAAPGSEWRYCELPAGVKMQAPVKLWRWYAPADFMAPRLHKWRQPRKRLWKRLQRFVRRARTLHAVRFNHEKFLWEGAPSLQLRRLADMRRAVRLRELTETAEKAAARVSALSAEAHAIYEGHWGRRRLGSPD